MRAYELMFIARPDLEEGEYDRLVERTSSIIQERGGSVENVDKWGKRRLAYEIAGSNEGYYVVVGFAGGSECVAELDRILKITDGVLRHLVVRREE